MIGGFPIWGQSAAGMTEDGFRCGDNTPREIRRNPRHVLLDIIGIMAVPIERGGSMSTGRGFRHGLGFSCGCVVAILLAAVLVLFIITCVG